MDEKEKLRAVMDCDPSFDGRFYYGVRSTGIYCRPSCKSKKPLPENILYFDTRFQAEAANFRPCKRCRPDLLGYDPDAETAERAKGLICLYYADAEALRGALSSIGLGRSRLTRIFEQRFGMSIKQYTDSVRLGKAKSLLEGGSSATDAALEIGFGSSAFSAFFKNHTGMSPAEYAACSPGAGHSCVMETPAGCLRITEGPQGVTSIAFVNQEPYSCGQGTYIPQAKGTGRILFRSAQRVYLPSGFARQRVPTARLGGAAPHPLRGNPLLSGDSSGYRQREGRPVRWHGEQP